MKFISIISKIGFCHITQNHTYSSNIHPIFTFLFISTQVAGICWVTVSYLIAAYATVKLGQPYPVESLSETAITVILGGGVLKVVQNIFEHNNGFIFGNSEKEENNNDTD